MSGEEIEQQGAKLWELQAKYNVLSAKVSRANNLADKTGRDSDRQEAVKQMNLLLALGEEIKPLEEVACRNQRKLEATGNEASQEEDARNFNIGYLKGTYVAIGFAGILLFISFVAGHIAELFE